MSPASSSAPFFSAAPGSVGLATAPTVPTSPRAHLAFDQYDAAVSSRTYRVFMPLVDPSATVVLPMFGRWYYPGTFHQGGDTDAGQPMTIAAAVELNDGTIVPFTFNGGRPTFTFPGGVGSGGVTAYADQPRSIGAQVATTSRRDEPASGFWLRTYVTVAAPRIDIGATVFDSPIVTDPAITPDDQGKLVTGNGIPEGCYVGTVTPGSAFLLSSNPTLQIDVVATATNASVQLELAVPVPLNLGPYHRADATTTSAGPDLTRPGSEAVSGGTGSYFYGPITVLTRQSPAIAGKPIVAVISDSILDGRSEDDNSRYFGPVARACTALGYPLVKLSKGGSGSGDMIPGTSCRYRLAFLDGATHAVVAVGTNDGSLRSPDDTARLKDRVLRLAEMLAERGSTAWLATVPPRTTSTDGWSTTANQTPVIGSQPHYLADFNQWARQVPDPFIGCFDLAAYCESSTDPDSGLWAPRATDDGIHPRSALMIGPISDGIAAIMSGWTA